ncbi:hypothetical protein HK100_007563, partial [Physocladia obscura]
MSSDESTSTSAEIPPSYSASQANYVVQLAMTHAKAVSQSKDVVLLSVKPPICVLASAPEESEVGSSEPSGFVSGLVAGFSSVSTLARKRSSAYAPSAPVSVCDPVRAPVRIVCVIDLSGSMDNFVALSSSSAPGEADGLSLLDIVKHACKTIVSGLIDSDSLAIVSFSDNAQIEMEMCTMNSTTASAAASANASTGRQRALDIIDRLETSGSTNIWAGLDLALNVMHGSNNSPSEDSASTAILLFTDGQPNIRPPNGELNMLNHRRKKFNGSLPCSVLNTFGFGYSLDSDLLNSLAIAGGGSFAFIPDAGFVGTVFVDAACNLFTSAARNVTLRIECQNGAQVELYDGNTRSFGGHPVKPLTSSYDNDDDEDSIGLMETNGFEINFGCIQHGQPKDVVLVMKKMPSNLNDSYLKVTLSYYVVGAGIGATAKLMSESFFSKARNGGDESIERPVAQWARLLAVDGILEAKKLSALHKYDDAKADISSLVERLKKVNAKISGNEKKRIKKLLVDVEGQVMEAIQQQYFEKWGKHYLLSLLNAHRLQQCNNFKDPGVQVYQTPLFELLREELNEIFLKIPAPKPSGQSNFRNSFYGPKASRILTGRIQRNSVSSITTNSASLNSASVIDASLNSPPVIDMSRYNDPNGVCFSGNCFITLADGNKVPVKTLKKGIAVLTGPNNMVRILNVNNSNEIRNNIVAIAVEPVHYARVECLVKTKVTPTTPLVCLSNTGLVITPYHPVQASSLLSVESGEANKEKYSNTHWKFPYTLADAEVLSFENKEAIEAIYSIVLGPVECADGDKCLCGGERILKQEYGESVWVNEVECAALGHGYVGEQAVIGHSYFGNRKLVLQDLQKARGFEEGVVECLGVVRSVDVGVVEGLVLL